jgi:monovalent cation:H+ antiporter-2, CPA2 family
MHSLDLILTLTGGLAAALAGGYLTNRLGLSPIVGYLFAGIAVGPYTPGFVADQSLAEQLAEIGVILLMFGVGLQFHLEELLAVRRVAIPGAIVQSVLATVLGALVARAYGWEWSVGIVFGLSLSVASTVVLVRVLTDNRHLHTPAGHIAVGWLVVEDIFTVIVLVLLPALWRPAAAETPLLLTVTLAVIKIGVLAVFTIVAGGRAIPWVLNHVASTRSRELFTLTVLVVALGIAVASAKIFGVSMALGAFLAGMVVGRSDFSVRAASEALPMRDAFAVLFFVSVGMLFDPQHLVRQPALIALTLAVVIVGKPLAALAIALVFRYPLDVALRVAVALAQIGEFSFILASLSLSLGIFTSDATHTLVATAIISITLNPILYRGIGPVLRWHGRRSRSLHVQPQEESAGEPSGHRAVVVGAGPIGLTVTRLLRENGIQPLVVELNMDTVRRLREQSVDAVYGDASHADTLVNAGVATARSLIISVAGLAGVEETIRIARELNPRVQILARTAYLREVPTLHSAGADLVFSGESEVALALTEAILENLGATPEQIERERARVHAELS